MVLGGKMHWSKDVHEMDDNAVGAYICNIIGSEGTINYLQSSNIDIQLI